MNRPGRVVQLVASLLRMATLLLSIGLASTTAVWAQIEDASIGDYVWHDRNGDGVQDAAEDGIPGVIVYLDLDDNGIRHPHEPFATTNANGAYDFTGLAAGTYVVRIDRKTIPDGYYLTTSNLPLAVILAESQDYNDADFGYDDDPENASIGDHVWLDQDADGIQDTAETGISGATVFLDLNDSAALDPGEPYATTGADGAYDIAGLAAGTYLVRVDDTTLPAGYALTTANLPLSVVLTESEDYNDADFGYQGYILDVSVVGSGSVPVEPDLPSYAYDTPVVLTPTADLGWTFDSWSGPDVGDLSDNGDGSWSLTMGASKLLTATFTQDQYNLNLSIVGDGLVIKNPDQPTYAYGTSVVLTPTPYLGWSFDSWSGPDVDDLSDNGDGSWSLTMDATKVLTATFTQDQYTLDLSTVGDGSVIKNPDLPTYTYGTSVVLTPTADLGWSFAGWSGPDVGDLTDNGDGTWSLTMDASKLLTATFTQDQYILGLSIVGDGSVIKYPDLPTYTYGTSVVLTPTAYLGWSFDSWSGPDVDDLSDNGDGTWSLTMDVSKLLTATFSQDQYTLGLSIVGDGSVIKNPDLPTYTYGTSVVLTPTADLGWSFAGWSGPDASDLSDNGDGTWSLTMDATKLLTATFTQGQYTLGLSIVGDGSVIKNPDLPTYTYGTSVVLTPTAYLGWSFAGWSGPDSADLSDNGDGSWSLTMDASKVLTATFTQDQYNLNLSIVGDGSVIKNPDQPTYTYGTSVVLTPTADLGWSFAGWSGPDSADLSDNGDGSWSLTMDASKVLTATFSLTGDQYTVDLSITGNGSVAVEPDKSTYYYGEEITLTATADPGWVFVGWSGDLAGDTNPATLIVLRDMFVIAVFAQDDYTLTVNTTGNGSVSKDPNQVIYHYGDEVTLTATPDSGWGFAGWSGDLDGMTNPASLIMDGHKTVSALFEWQHDLTVETVGTGNVVLDPPGGVYSHDTVVQITAIPDPGWTFSGWSGDLSGTDNPTYITINRDKNVTASFIYLVHLPMVFNRWPPLPSVPSLNPIDNADGDGNYTVGWSAASDAETYLLQEATNSSFSDATVIYSGPSTNHAVSSRGAARYYYRVKARNIWADSGWSNIRQVDVLWEAEPNDAHTQANGPIKPNLVHYGTFPNADDVSDYFFFDLTTARRVALWLTNIPSGQNYDLILRDASLVEEGYSGNLSNSDEYIRTDSILSAGRYYIQVHHRSAGGSTQPYHLEYRLE